MYVGQLPFTWVTCDCSKLLSILVLLVRRHSTPLALFMLTECFCPAPCFIWQRLRHIRVHCKPLPNASRLGMANDFGSLKHTHTSRSFVPALDIPGRNPSRSSSNSKRTQHQTQCCLWPGSCSTAANVQATRHGRKNYHHRHHMHQIMAVLKTAAIQHILPWQLLKDVYGLVIKHEADDCPSDARASLQGNSLKCLRSCTLASGNEPTKSWKLWFSPIAREDRLPWNHNKSLAGPPCPFHEVPTLWHD
jgi:hypothetical protein